MNGCVFKNAYSCVRIILNRVVDDSRRSGLAYLDAVGACILDRIAVYCGCSSSVNQYPARTPSDSEPLNSDALSRNRDCITTCVGSIDCCRSLSLQRNGCEPEADADIFITSSAHQESISRSEPRQKRVDGSRGAI